MNKNKLIDAEIGVSNNYIFYEDNNGFLWIGNETGIHRLDPKTGENQNYKLFENYRFSRSNVNYF